MDCSLLGQLLVLLFSCMCVGLSTIDNEVVLIGVTYIALVVHLTDNYIAMLGYYSYRHCKLYLFPIKVMLVFTSRSIDAIVLLSVVAVLDGMQAAYIVYHNRQS
jgi:hypothetical protein